MVAAADALGFKTPDGEWRVAVAAAVLERGDLAVGAEKNDGAVQECSSDGPVLKLAGKASHIPLIEREHPGSISSADIQSQGLVVLSLKPFFLCALAPIRKLEYFTGWVASKRGTEK